MSSSLPPLDPAPGSAVGTDVSVIIVSYNTRDLTCNCVRSLIENTGELSLEIIVVDNGSNDDSVPCLAREFSPVRLIENSENTGYARACNQGMAAAGGRYLLLLNSDTVVTPGAVGRLLEFCTGNPGAGLVSGQLYNRDGTIQNTATTIPRPLFLPMRRNIGRNVRFLLRCLREGGAAARSRPPTTAPHRVEAIFGACMFFPRSTLEITRGFDERYFFYFEDMDLCRRINEAGLGIYLVPEAVIYHHRGSSASNREWKSDQFFRSRYLYYQKFFPPHTVALVQLRDKLRSLLRVIFYGTLIGLTLGRVRAYRNRLIQWRVLLGIPWIRRKKAAGEPS